jgi:hypothetical protein
LNLKKNLAFSIIVTVLLMAFYGLDLVPISSQNWWDLTITDQTFYSYYINPAIINRPSLIVEIKRLKKAFEDAKRRGIKLR